LSTENAAERCAKKFGLYDCNSILLTLSSSALSDFCFHSFTGFALWTDF